MRRRAQRHPGGAHPGAHRRAAGPVPARHRRHRRARPAQTGPPGHRGAHAHLLHDDQHLLAAIRAGAIAYLPKTAGVDQVVTAVRAAARGESVLEPRIAARLVREVRQASARRRPLDQLSPASWRSWPPWPAAAPTARSPRRFGSARRPSRRTSPASWPSCSWPTAPRPPSSACSSAWSPSTRRSTTSPTRTSNQRHRALAPPAGAASTHGWPPTRDRWHDHGDGGRRDLGERCAGRRQAPDLHRRSPDTCRVCRRSSPSRVSLYTGSLIHPADYKAVTV